MCVCVCAPTHICIILEIIIVVEKLIVIIVVEEDVNCFLVHLPLMKDSMLEYAKPIF